MKPTLFAELALQCNRSPVIFGPRYMSRYRRYWTTDVEAMLLRVANHAIEHVPFYRAAVSNRRVNTLSEFVTSFPTIDKQQVMHEPGVFVSERIEHHRYDRCTTGGTSGKPLQLLLPKSRYVHEFAALHRIWAEVGYKFSPRAVVRNAKIDKGDFTIDPVRREYVFDGFRSDDQYLMRIYEVMKKHRVAFYHGYTSNAFEFARFILREKLDCSFIKAFLTTSENLHKYQDAVFDELGVPHMNFYGHSEKLVLAARCVESKLYHFHQQYGFPEILNEAGRRVEDVGAVGEVVGSTIYNEGMPLLRYRTGDFARFAGTGKCASCGHEGLSASEILGRWGGDRVFNVDGSFVTTTALNLHSDLYAHVDGLQYVQTTPGELTVRVIPSPTFNEGHAARLVADVGRKLGGSSSVRVQAVESLERAPNGKFLLLVSSLNRTTHNAVN